MQSKYFCVLYILVFGVLLSCGTTRIVFDENVPRGNTATLQIQRGFIIKSCNGVNIEEKTGNRETELNIPAGKTELIMEMVCQIGANFYTAKNVTLDYFFEAGRKYRIGFWFVDEDGKIGKPGYFIIPDTGKPCVYISEESNFDTALIAWEFGSGSNYILE
jgi:hypothetical protein